MLFNIACNNTCHWENFLPACQTRVVVKYLFQDRVKMSYTCFPESSNFVCVWVCVGEREKERESTSSQVFITVPHVFFKGVMKEDISAPL